MTPEEAVRKAMALLRLSQSSNPHEAALAAAKAQDIIERHNLEDIIAAERDGTVRVRINITDEPFYTGRDFWKNLLGMALCKHNNCTTYQFIGTTEHRIVGYPDDIATVAYLFDWLTRELEQLSYFAAVFGDIDNSVTARNNFKIGAVHGIEQALAQQKLDLERDLRARYGEPRASHALVVRGRDRKEIDRWMSTKHPSLKTVRIKSGKSDDLAKRKGYQAGQAIDLGSTRDRLPSPRKTLPGE